MGGSNAVPNAFDYDPDKVEEEEGTDSFQCCFNADLTPFNAVLTLFKRPFNGNLGEDSLTEIMVHQSIHMFEYCLGAKL
jgi:hypothetical protein